MFTFINTSRNDTKALAFINSIKISIHTYKQYTWVLGMLDGAICSLVACNKKHPNYLPLCYRALPYIEVTAAHDLYWKAIKNHLEKDEELSIPIMLSGTPFERKIWHYLATQVPKGSTTSYSEIAANCKSPTAIRATASAIGRNCIGLIIPCHRILPKTGHTGKYAWGAELKQHLLDFELESIKLK